MKGIKYPDAARVVGIDDVLLHIHAALAKDTLRAENGLSPDLEEQKLDALFDVDFEHLFPITEGFVRPLRLVDAGVVLNSELDRVTTVAMLQTWYGNKF